MIRTATRLALYFVWLLVIVQFNAKTMAQTTPAQPQPLSHDIQIVSPHNYQVFQRSSRTRGQIKVSGKVLSPCTRVEARITGKSMLGILPGRWIEIPFTPVDRLFNSSLPISAGGWYRVEIRATIGVRIMAEATVPNAGVGEVFVGAGQSNSTNYGEERLTPATGMVSSFSGTEWQLAADPQPGAHDASQGGSFWPAFGDAMYERLHVPIGVAVTGHGGTSVEQWQPDTDLFRWMMTRIYKLGRSGFRAVLWHQGESDVAMSSDKYAGKLTNVINGSVNEAGWQFPWFVAQVSYHSKTEPSFPRIRDGQKQLWDTGIALEGPDTDTLDGDNRDTNGAGIHLSGKGLRAHGKMWADKVAAYVQGVLK